MDLADQLKPDDGATDDLERRFSGVARLFGADGFSRLLSAHVCVLGVGGVGSWVVEALARSGVGSLTMIDLDHVSESNINRQVHAVTATIGESKVLAMARRVSEINPSCIVTVVDDFIDASNVAQLLSPGQFDYVVDAVDSVQAKVAIVVHCCANHIPLVTIGGAGGQVDPTRVRVVDLSQTEHEPLLAKVRRTLRTQHGFSRDIKKKFGVAAVFSDEPLHYPAATDEFDGTGHPSVAGLNCAGFGSTVTVTAVFGFVAAGYVLRVLARAAHGAA